MSKKTFEELLLTGKLPSPAGVGMRILQLTRTDDFSVEEMGETIRVDSALTGRILKLANSALLGGAHPVTTVREAIMRLGSRSVRDLALAFSLVSERRKTSCKSFDFERYWSKSLARAVCAQAFCRLAGTGSPPEAYIGGLLGEIGRLALAFVHPQEYGELMARGLARDSAELARAENEAFGIDHRRLAACLVAEWGLPDAFVASVRDFWAPPTDTEGWRLLDLTSVLRHAETLASIFVTGAGAGRTVWRRHAEGLDRAIAALDSDEERLELLFDECIDEWTSWGDEMQIAVQRDLRYRKARSMARESIEGEMAQGPEASPAPRLASPEPAVRPGVQEPVHILAVDDEPVQRKLLQKHLSQDGYVVTLAKDGAEALKMALETNPDIVIADYMMPEMDGLELCRLLRKTDAGSRMYFLLLTGRTEPEMLIEAFDAGCNDFVTKPFVPALLGARIRGGVRVVRLQRKVDADRVTMERQMAELGVLTHKLRTAAMTDALTGLPNRRHAMKRLEGEWAFTMRTGRPLSLIMADIDHFKQVNDRHGHDAGDAVLVETAKLLARSLRESDEVFRLGGEEFLVVCRNTSQQEGGIVAERLRKAVEQNAVLSNGVEHRLTISLGVAGSSREVEGVEQLLKAADEAVYEAKRQGRNRFCLAPAGAPQKKSA